MTWVVEPERGMDALCQHASIESKAGSRTRPDGVSVRWKGAGLGQVGPSTYATPAAMYTYMKTLHFHDATAETLRAVHLGTWAT